MVQKGSLDFWEKSQDNVGDITEGGMKVEEGESPWLNAQDILDPNFQLACGRPLRNSVSETRIQDNISNKPHWAWEARTEMGRGVRYPTAQEYARLKGWPSWIGQLFKDTFPDNFGKHRLVGSVPIAFARCLWARTGLRCGKAWSTGLTNGPLGRDRVQDKLHAKDGTTEALARLHFRKLDFSLNKSEWKEWCRNATSTLNGAEGEE